MKLVREHRPFVLVLAGSALLRLVFWLTFRPALMWSDSWAYVDTAFGATPVGLAPDRPSGYPLVLRLLSLPSKSLEVVTAIQHGAGLVTGVLAYALLSKMGVRRWAATLAAAVVLLDAYALILGQFVLAETFFMVALMGSAWLAVFRRDEWWGLVASGLLLAGAGLIRSAGLFAIPVWLLYVMWKREQLARSLALATAAVVLPLGAYLTLHAADGRGFNFTNSDGWFLYGRVAQLADCSRGSPSGDSGSLCTDAAAGPPEDTTPGFYVWNDASPARKLFPEGMTPQSNARLRSFAVDTIRERPLPYARLVLSEFTRFFKPASGGVGTDLAMPEGPPEEGSFVREARLRRYPSYRTPTVGDGSLLRDYRHWFRTPRWLLGLMAVAAMAEGVLGLMKRRPAQSSFHREVLFLAGLPLVALVVTVAVADFAVRYLVPFMPLLVCAGTLAIFDLLRPRTPAPADGGGEPTASPVTQ
ncbi:MAG TPA: phospholipid carrier-dependent glycosyltransferase [Acidimicrobiales bacterium]|nr:phospholipid carrier-dependent glycosyltransferase [Acidimicrobiales bacterium]